MGGLLVATLVTLVLVPVIYSLFEEKLRNKGRFMEAVRNS
jgi:HAE1 family hydrophobic/amphiphilic exporter-1